MNRPQNVRLLRFSYATARVAGRPLLCVGDDFPLTDLPLVPHT